MKSEIVSEFKEARTEFIHVKQKHSGDHSSFFRRAAATILVATVIMGTGLSFSGCIGGGVNTNIRRGRQYPLYPSNFKFKVYVPRGSGKVTYNR